MACALNGRDGSRTTAPVPQMLPSLMAAWGSAKKTSAPGTMTRGWMRLPARASLWSKSPP